MDDFLVCKYEAQQRCTRLISHGRDWQTWRHELKDNGRSVNCTSSEAITFVSYKLPLEWDKLQVPDKILVLVRSFFPKDQISSCLSKDPPRSYPGKSALFHQLSTQWGWVRLALRRQLHCNISLDQQMLALNWVAGVFKYLVISKAFN